MDLWTSWMFQPCFSFSFNPFWGYPPLLHTEKGSGALVSLKQAPVRALAQNITIYDLNKLTVTTSKRANYFLCEKSKLRQLTSVHILTEDGREKQEIWRREKKHKQMKQVVQLERQVSQSAYNLCKRLISGINQKWLGCNVDLEQDSMIFWLKLKRPGTFYIHLLLAKH